MGDGIERIEEEDVLAAVRAQARRVLYKSFLAAGALTILFLLLA